MAVAWQRNSATTTANLENYNNDSGGGGGDIVTPQANGE